MITLTNKTIEEVSATDIQFHGNTLSISLNDGRDISILIDKFKWLDWLVKASPEQRAKWYLEPGGFAIYWEDLDNGIEIRHLLGTQPLQ